MSLTPFVPIVLTVQGKTGGLGRGGSTLKEKLKARRKNEKTLVLSPYPMVEGVGERAPFYFFVEYHRNHQNHDRAVQGSKSVTYILKHMSELSENHQIFTKMENKN